jgi:RNA polymerase sigma-70 factor, ECF subfamily
MALVCSEAVPPRINVVGGVIGSGAAHRTARPVSTDAAANEAVVVAAGGDLETLFRQHSSRLVRALTAAGGSREAATEAVQDAFVQAYVHWRKVRRYDDPVGWIRRVAINRLRDSHRGDQRRSRLRERLGALPATTADDPAVTARGADRRTIEFLVEELSVNEVAAALAISEGAVKFHLHQGRQRLRALVEADDARGATEDEQWRPRP